MSENLPVPTPSGAIMPPRANDARFEGIEQTDLILPRAQIYQGAPGEKSRYGEKSVGSIFNTLTGEILPSKEFVPLKFFKSYVKFRQPFGSGIDYNVRDKGAVPPADLKWAGEGRDRKPPACTEIINAIVVFRGTDTPIVLSFKKTGFKAGQSLVTQEQYYRGDKGPGFYALDNKPESRSGNDFIVPKIRPAGDVPAEMKPAVDKLLALVVNANFTVADEGLDVHEDI